MARNRLFLLGVVVLLLGAHFHVVESLVLNEKASAFLAKRFEKPSATAIPDPLDTYEVSYDAWDAAPTVSAATPKRTVTPPDWLSWSLISVGSVLILTCPCFR